MNGLLIASAGTNLVLIVASLLLYHSNSDLTETVGKRDTTITFQETTEKALRGEVQQCQTARKTEILQCNDRIDAVQKMSAKRAEEIRVQVASLQQERGNLERLLRNVPEPERKLVAQDRIDAVNNAINAYIVELNR